MVHECRRKLTTRELKHYKECRVRVARVPLASQVNRVTLWGYSLKSADLHRYQKGRPFALGEDGHYDEILIDNKAARVQVGAPDLQFHDAGRKPLAGRMLNGRAADKSVESGPAAKPVSSSSSSSVYVAARHGAPPSARPVKNYESMYKEYLQRVQMNGAYSGVEQPTPASTSQPEGMAADAAEDSPPKRKRGRPKGSGNKRREDVPVESPSPVRKRGWPLGVPRKGYSAAKNRRGRPRKPVEFGFHSIVSDIKTIALPSDLWSAHVSVTAKRSQVCFTRVVQAVSSTVPVECDRSVKFNGTLQHLVRINNRDVELLGAPTAVRSLRDVQTLLEIVNDIGINDPVLDYLNR